MDENCYPNDRIPREQLHQQDERLQTRHIQTLQFVQEIAAENKELKRKIEEYETKFEKCKELHALAEESKDRITNIQEEYLKRADEMTAMLTEKHKTEIMQLVSEKLEQEKTLKEEISKLKDDIMEIERKNQHLLLTLEGQQVLQHQINEEKLKNKNLLDELMRMKQESSGRSVNLEDMGALQAKNIQLTEEVLELTQKNSELNFRISKLQKDSQDNIHDQDKVTLIENLKVKVTQMQKDRGIALERERNYEKSLQELQAEMEALRESISASEMSKQKLFIEYQKVLSELNYLKKQYNVDSSKSSFRDFVNIKRELNDVKTENSDLRRAIRSQGRNSLPRLKYESSGSEVSLLQKKRGSETGIQQRRGSDASVLSCSSRKSLTKEPKKITYLS